MGFSLENSGSTGIDLLSKSKTEKKSSQKSKLKSWAGKKKSNFHANYKEMFLLQRNLYVLRCEFYIYNKFQNVHLAYKNKTSYKDFFFNQTQIPDF